MSLDSALFYLVMCSRRRVVKEYNSCHLQKQSDDPAVVGCLNNGHEEEYRAFMDDFVEWSRRIHVLVNK